MEKQKAKEKRRLVNIAIVGWLNLSVFSACFLLSKGGMANFQIIFLALTFLVSLAGTIFYYTQWESFFSFVTQLEGRGYFAPYRLGIIIPLGGITFLYGLFMVAGGHG